MKIITWNCNMAFRKKLSHVLPLNPDILIIPECEHPDKFKLEPGKEQPTGALWFGHNRNKGLGVFAYGKIKLRLLRIHNPKFRTIVPISVSSPKYKFTLYAIWANNPQDPDGTYVEQIWKAIHYYESHLTNKTSMLVGDFNSNTIWDRPRRKSNHSNVVKFLEEKGIYSCYHLYHQQEQGKEKHPTLYMYRHKDKPYHIDYCFISKELAQHLHSVDVGDFEIWTKHSDHVPVIVTLK